MAGFPLLIKVMTGMLPNYNNDLAEFAKHFLESSILLSPQQE